MNVKLKAVKGLTYNTRRLLPGDVFDASPRDARLLLAIRKAEAMREPVELPPPPPAVAEKIAATFVPPTPPNDPNPPPIPPNDPNPPTPPPDYLAALRAEYEAALGKRPFMGWDAATLREKIAAAKSSIGQ